MNTYRLSIMWPQEHFRIVCLLILTQIYINKSEDDQPCCNSWNKSGWYELGQVNLQEPVAVCKDGATAAKVSKGQTILINFQPTNQFGIVGISACVNDELNDCYVADIFGLISGRLGYWWRKHSPNEQGENRWVPGRVEQLPSTVLQNESKVGQGTWDQDGKTVYQIYVERTLDDRLEIRLNGGDAKQQKEMSFALPENYSWLTVASFYNNSKPYVQGATGCSKFRRMQFDPGQDLRINWLRPFGAIGYSLCTDSGQSDCYVLDMFGYYDKQISYWWRKHSASEQNGQNGWVPGRETKTLANILKKGKNEKSKWETKRLNLIMKRTFDGKLYVTVVGGDPGQAPELVFEVANNYRYGTVSSLARVFGIELSYAYISILGPCFHGETFGYLSPTCNHQIPLNDLRNSSTEPLRGIWSPKPGKTIAEMQSPVLNTGSSRQQLCISLTGIVSQWGASISVSAMASSGNSEEMFVGKLIHNGVNPPEWQPVRLSVELPPALRNLSLVIKLTAERTSGSLLLLKKAELCSYDGCGLPTADGTPYITYGQRAPLAKYPWHTAVFKTHDGVVFDYICGGSLIRSDVVISAAHCFFNEQNQLEDKTKFKLAVGKVYNTLYQFEPYQQLSSAFEIIVPSRYKGETNNFIYDIAIVRVSFNTSSIILPACIDWSNRALPRLQSGNMGEVAGWGVTERGVNSRELLFANLPYIPYEQCAATVPETFLRFVTTDKFCAGNVNGQTVRKGDSGGGLVFKTGGLWYLRGIVSTGVPNKLTYTTFTDVTQFIPWAKQVLNIQDDFSDSNLRND